ncbi:hypothetical protein [Paenalcaligenes suwonensis]|uniref:hypothetical protein n=1 Tax=Paenalcaligenes suwonensis TaxID=1202713 RepID=UPI001409B228|nr:hypothetical protein [Paenalcaligenes suwonensis]NHC60661.1 hypothetical protein [Paenalcaligenes suwonensis]
MHSESRRAFLSGRRQVEQVSAWDQFCLQLSQKAEGEKSITGEEQMLFVPETPADVHHARHLCGQHQVVMGLAEIPHRQQEDVLPTLWINPKKLKQFQILQPETGQWFVQPGCLLGELSQAGLHALAAWPAEWSIAAWLLDRHSQSWRTGYTHLSGVVHASLLMDDGSVSSLGAFGQNNTKPLNTARLRQLVPQLFQLQTSPVGQACLAQPTWEARYRLDALQPAQADRDLNLAHLLLGSGGDLGWLEWVVLDARVLADATLYEQAQLAAGREKSLQVAAMDSDMEMKQCFDPKGCFTHPAQEWDSIKA